LRGEPLRRHERPCNRGSRGPRNINPELNLALEEVILHALERDPRKRYQSAAQMKRDLDNLEGVEITHRDQRLRAPSRGRAAATPCS